MCYFLYIASPLTLSEVRSMIPAGLTADLAAFPEQRALKALHPRAQTVARILAGRCSCDLIRPRLSDAKDDERHLRSRYRRLQVPRPAVIAALERHRRTGADHHPGDGWPTELSRFVVEHARNAGPTLYLLHFGSSESVAREHPKVVLCSVSEVRRNPGGWLVEEAPAVVG
jgi:hypothetical protein